MEMHLDDIAEIVLKWCDLGNRVALATVIETWGSAPRREGSQLAVSCSGEFVGSVSGGCVEGAVVEEALNAIKTGDSTIVEYGVGDDVAFSVGLACGGKIRIMIEPVNFGTGISLNYIKLLNEIKLQRKSAVLITNTKSFERTIFRDNDSVSDIFDDLEINLVDLLSDGRSFSKSCFFVHIIKPPLKLIIVGAVHIAQALTAMARVLGYETIIIDPRNSFATKTRFPEVELINTWPDEAIISLRPDNQTAILTLTHDEKLDDPAIRVALKSKVFYLGCLGSRKTHEARKVRMLNEGFTSSELERIFGPIGLNIGAKSPAEIALAILAQVTNQYNKANQKF